jgi:hypothetical protein
LSAYFSGLYNKWDGNYYDKPRNLPQLIFGTIPLGIIQIPWINIDWHPAKEPYYIPL